MKKLIGLTLLCAAGMASAGPYHTDTINPSDTSSGPDVTLSTFMSVPDNALPWPATTFQMEFVPLLPQTYARGQYNPAVTNCLVGCDANQFQTLPSDGLILMDATFKISANEASVMLTKGWGGFAQAFNAQDQLIGYCESGISTYVGGNSNCFSQRHGNEILTLNDPGISTLLIGTWESVSQVKRISYSVPEPPTLGLFALGLAGMGFVRRRRAN